jgi:1,4-alpha-glucan branching enzyme
MKKRYLKSKPICKVTFRLPKAATASAKTVKLVGDFNDWNRQRGVPLKKLKNGDFTATLDLACGREYQFRYLKDDQEWENDWNADRYVPNPYGDGDNSVVVV